MIGQLWSRDNEQPTKCFSSSFTVLFCLFFLVIFLRVREQSASHFMSASSISMHLFFLTLVSFSLYLSKHSFWFYVFIIIPSCPLFYSYLSIFLFLLVHFIYTCFISLLLARVDAYFFSFWICILILFHSVQGTVL